MTDDETKADESQEASQKDEAEDNRPDDTLAENKKCPECGAPVDDVRATCINCGYEYSEEDHEDPEAGNEFVSGSQIDDQGNELPDEEPAAASTSEEPEDGDK